MAAAFRAILRQCRTHLECQDVWQPSSDRTLRHLAEKQIDARVCIGTLASRHKGKVSSAGRVMRDGREFARPLHSENLFLQPQRFVLTQAHLMWFIQNLHIFTCKPSRARMPMLRVQIKSKKTKLKQQQKKVAHVAPMRSTFMLYESTVIPHPGSPLTSSPPLRAPDEFFALGGVLTFDLTFASPLA